MSIEMTADPADPGVRHRRPRHEVPVQTLLDAWAEVPRARRIELRRAMPPALLPPLARLMDPHGLHGHSDAVAVARTFHELSSEEVEELARMMPLPLFWALARLSQNLR